MLKYKIPQIVTLTRNFIGNSALSAKTKNSETLDN